MTRRLLNLLTLLSLLLCVAAAAMWVRSYYVWEAVATATNVSDGGFATLTDQMLRSVHGRLSWSETKIRWPDRAESLDAWAGAEPAPRWRYVRNEPQPMSGFGWWARNGLRLSSAFDKNGAGQSSSTRSAHIPYWVLVPLLAVAPARRAWLRLRRARWARASRCPACGYDLRATPGQCPECGTAAALRPVPRPDPS